MNFHWTFDLFNEICKCLNDNIINPREAVQILNFRIRRCTGSWGNFSSRRCAVGGSGNWRKCHLGKFHLGDCQFREVTVFRQLGDLSPRRYAVWESASRRMCQLGALSGCSGSWGILPLGYMQSGEVLFGGSASSEKFEYSNCRYTEYDIYNRSIL